MSLSRDSTTQGAKFGATEQGSTGAMSTTYRKLETLDDLKAAIAEHREEGRRIIRHFKRLEQEYSDWEDRLVAIEQEIDNCEKQTGLAKEEIMAPKSTVDSIIEDIFN